MYRYFLPYTVIRAGNDEKIELKFILVVVVIFISYYNVVSVRNALEIALNHSIRGIRFVGSEFRTTIVCILLL